MSLLRQLWLVVLFSTALALVGGFAVNLSTARRPTYAPRRVHVDFPGSMISAPDLKTVRLGTAAIRAACSSV